MPTWVAIDIETDPEDGDRLLCLGLCWQDVSAPDGLRTVVLTPGSGPKEGEDADHELAVRMLQDPAIVKVEHSKFDYVTLTRLGWRIEGPIHDTMVMAWLLNENQSLRLEDLIVKYLKYDPDKRLRRSENRVWFRCDDGREVQIGSAPIDELVAYNRRDIIGTARLYMYLLRELDEQLWLQHFVEELVPFTKVLADMELAGLPIDVEATEKLRDELEEKAAQLKASLLERAGLPPMFNIGSNDQLSAYLFSFRFRVPGVLDVGPDVAQCVKSCLDGEHEDCEDGEDVPASGRFHIIDLLPRGFTVESVGREKVHGWWSLKGRNLPLETSMGRVPMTESGSRYRVDTPTLMTHFAEDEWVRDLVSWRKLDKLLTTYLRKFPLIAKETSTGTRVYGKFNQTGTKTGRLSSSDPNLQNIPARGELGERVRDLFRSETGLIVADYSQLEPRLMAHFSQDPRLLHIYRNNLDVYSITGEAIFGKPLEKGMVERDIAKVVFLGTQYGAAGHKLATILCLNGFPTTPETADAYLAELRRFYRVLYEWKDAVVEHVRRVGYVRTIGGHHRRLRYQFTDKANWRNIGYGERQAVNAIIQGSAGDVVRRVMVRGRWLKEMRLIAQVHDELVWEWCAPRRPSREQMEHIREQGERAHGFDLDVPLVFEPHWGRSWASAKEGAEESDVDLSPLDEDSQGDVS